MKLSSEQVFVAGGFALFLTVCSYGTFTVMMELHDNQTVIAIANTAAIEAGIIGTVRLIDRLRKVSESTKLAWSLMGAAVVLSVLANGLAMAYTFVPGWSIFARIRAEWRVAVGLIALFGACAPLFELSFAKLMTMRTEEKVQEVQISSTDTPNVPLVQNQVNLITAQPAQIVQLPDPERAGEKIDRERARAYLRAHPRASYADLATHLECSKSGARLAFQDVWPEIESALR